MCTCDVNSQKEIEQECCTMYDKSCGSDEDCCPNSKCTEEGNTKKCKCAPNADWLYMIIFVKANSN